MKRATFMAAKLKSFTVLWLNVKCIELFFGSEHSCFVLDGSLRVPIIMMQIPETVANVVAVRGYVTVCSMPMRLAGEERTRWHFNGCDEN